jgi:hypothetical protein
MGNFLLKMKKMSSQNCDSRTDSIRRVSKGRSHKELLSLVKILKLLNLHEI